MRSGFPAVSGVPSTVASASADPQGTTPDCFGKDVVYYAQAYGGISNAAAAYGLTVPEGHNIVLTLFCDRTNGVVPTH